MVDIPLQCRCGRVQGSLSGVNPRGKRRVICCCESCQRFARYLGRKEQICDDFGGTEIVQATSSQVHIKIGLDRIHCVRLTEKGLYRWYTQCCHTAIGNTLGAGVPFMGVIVDFIADKKNLDETIGPVRAIVQSRYASGEHKHDKIYPKFEPGTFSIGLFKLLIARLQGKHKPNPFFTDEGAPIIKPKIYQGDLKVGAS